MALDTALLTVSAIVMRCIGMAFQVWLVGRIGASGIGLYQLVASVNILCVTFAVSGIRFTTTRLISEEIGSESWGSIGKAMGRCVCYALFFGLAAFAVLFLCAEPIGFLWVGDARTVMSLEIVAFRMPFVAVSSVLGGYFIATGRAYKSAGAQFVEQLIGIGLVMFFLSRAPENDLERSCAAVSLGGTIADAASMLIVSCLYIQDRRRYRREGGSSLRLTQRMFKIAVPLALSAYARTSLSTLEELLVPRKLKASGMSANEALAGYGTITGMVFPIIGFPACLLSAMAEIVIPDLTEAQVKGDFAYIRRTVSTLLRVSLLFSLLTAAFIFSTAAPLGMLIYGNDGISGYIKVLALLAPVMYMDIVTDGCLKGLGQMMNSMCYNIAEALIGVLLVVAILPRWALKGYIFVLYFCEIFNFALSIGRLRRVTKFSLLPEKVICERTGGTGTNPRFGRSLHSNTAGSRSGSKWSSQTSTDR
jgi:stage V sporulation protein B